MQNERAVMDFARSGSFESIVVFSISCKLASRQAASSAHSKFATPSGSTEYNFRWSETAVPNAAIPQSPSAIAFDGGEVNLTTLLPLGSSLFPKVFPFV